MDLGHGVRVRRKVTGVETWEALRSRRNVREFSPRPVGEEELARILEAGRLAPSAKNWQPWDFVLVTDLDQLRDEVAPRFGVQLVADDALVAVVGMARARGVA
jgi:nitroreductase